MKITFIVPCFNAEKNLENVYDSLICQTDKRWSCVMIDDISEDKTWDKMNDIAKRDERFSCIKRSEKFFALRNIISVARKYQKDETSIVGVIDGDDSLCNSNAVSLLLGAYENGYDVVWTAHKWDINGMNISREMPENVDPYHWVWCSSHLRTFKSSILKNISDRNFKDTKGEWFKRGYDQALMLPVLSLGKSRKYIDTVCYLYNIESVSVNDRDWAEMNQISTINLVRARGFLD